MSGEVVEPAAADRHRLRERVREASRIQARGRIARNRHRKPDAGESEEDKSRGRAQGGHAGGTRLQVTFSLQGEVVGAVHDHHRDADNAAEQSERVEQREERAFIVDTHRGVDPEGHALQQVAESDAADDRRDGRAEEEERIPEGAPLGAVNLAAVVEGHRAEDQHEQHDEQRPVEA